MEIKYDSEADALYIELKKGKFDHNKEIDKNIIVNYDNDNNILGIEILFVKENNPQLLNDIIVKNLVAA